MMQVDKEKLKAILVSGGGDADKCLAEKLLSKEYNLADAGEDCNDVDDTVGDGDKGGAENVERMMQVNKEKLKAILVSGGGDADKCLAEKLLSKEYNLADAGEDCNDVDDTVGDGDKGGAENVERMMQVNKEKLKAILVSGGGDADKCLAEKLLSKEYNLADAGEDYSDVEDTVGHDDEGGAENVEPKVNDADPINKNPSSVEKYSSRVFIGGLPPDTDCNIIFDTFKTYGSIEIDWPNKIHTPHPPKGYAFLIFKDKQCIQKLIDACIVDCDKFYIQISTPSVKNKWIQVRPWALRDARYILDKKVKANPRNTVFLGGVPRTMKASDVAVQISRIFGAVQCVKIDTDWYQKYPKGSARVYFVNQQSFLDAVDKRFVFLVSDNYEKRVEVKANILSNQICDNCIKQNLPEIAAPYFCTNATCVQYYCINCWSTVHSNIDKKYHKPIVKGNFTPTPNMNNRQY